MMSTLQSTARRRAVPANSSGIGRTGQTVLGAIATAVLLVLIAPMIVVVVVSFSLADFVIFPPPGFGLKWYSTFFATPDFVSAFLMSTEVALGASAAATLLGVPASYVLIRRQFIGKRVLAAMFLSPLMVPQIVVGVGLLQFYAWWGVSNTLAGLIAAHTVVVLPYVVRTVGASLLSLNPQVEEAAADLGAGTLSMLALVVVPMIRGGVPLGRALCHDHVVDQRRGQHLPLGDGHVHTAGADLQLHGIFADAAGDRGGGIVDAGRGSAGAGDRPLYRLEQRDAPLDRKTTRG